MKNIPKKFKVFGQREDNSSETIVCSLQNRIIFSRKNNVNIAALYSPGIQWISHVAGSQTFWLLTTSLSFPLIFRKCLLNSNPSPYIRNNIQKIISKETAIKSNSLQWQVEINTLRYVQLQFPSSPLLKTKYPRRYGYINNFNLILGHHCSHHTERREAETMASYLCPALVSMSMNLNHCFPQVLGVYNPKLSYTTTLKSCPNTVVTKPVIQL